MMAFVAPIEAVFPPCDDYAPAGGVSQAQSTSYLRKVRTALEMGRDCDAARKRYALNGGVSGAICVCSKFEPRKPLVQARHFFPGFGWVMVV